MPTTKGARLMLSTPPATNTFPSPQVMAWAADMMAFMPLPQLRCTTLPGTSMGRPANKVA